MLGPFVSASVVSLVFSLPPSLSPMSYAYIILKKKKKKKRLYRSLVSCYISHNVNIYII